MRDFGSLSLPWSPSNPVRVFINLHRYNDGLHSFRQYSADGDVTYESCNGLLKNRKVHISLDNTDIKPAATGTLEYKACFDGMETGWAAYATPH